MNKKAILFPGQGVQYLGMGKTLYDKYDKVKKLYKEASDYAGFDVPKICFEGSNDTLKLTEYTQPTVLISSYAAAQVLKEEYGYKADFVGGHSLGEITACAFSGGISFGDAVSLVRLRGKYMQEAVKEGEGAMSAVMGIDASVIAQVCEEIKGEYIVEVSNKNSPFQTVVSGHEKAVSQAEKKLKKLGAKVVRLGVSAPFHCSLMEPAAKQFKEKLDTITFHSMEIPVVSSVTGTLYLKETDMKTLWVCQLTRPVEWSKCIKFLLGQGVTSFVDAGPGETIRNLVKANQFGFETISLDKDESAFEKAVGKLSV